MKFNLHQNLDIKGAPVLSAFAEGIKTLGHNIVEKDEDVNVIWSSQWDGWDQKNREIYEKSKKNQKSVIFLDHGILKRNQNFLVGLEHTNGQGIFANESNLDYARPEKIGIFLKNTTEIRRQAILIICQPERSLSWSGMPTTNDWIKNTVSTIKKFTNRKLVVRSHPRASTPENSEDYTIISPQKLTHGFDDEPVDYNYHCVVTHDSFHGVLSAIAGTPVICDTSSLASKISGNFENIEKISLPERHEWFVKTSHCEWSLEEISKGMPLNRLLPYLLG
jgi:hypothetical protein